MKNLILLLIYKFFQFKFRIYFILNFGYFLFYVTAKFEWICSKRIPKFLSKILV